MSGRRKEKADNSEDWMGTYADAITLLLCFFVLMLSVSEPKMSKFEDIRKGLLSEFFSSVPSSPISSMFDALSQTIEEEQIEDDALVMETDNGIMFELAGDMLFQSGTAQFTPKAIAALEEIGFTLTDFEFEDYHIIVEGHTDDEPIATREFPSNWELSAVRAVKAVRLFVEMGVPADRIQAVAYADTMPKVPNLDVTGEPIAENRALNRRLVINLERED